jgi:hypothetical protein
MLADMKMLACLAVLLAASSSPAFAGASNFTLVDGVSGLSDYSIRRAGTNDWKPLARGSSGAVQFNDPDCAFDIKATVGGTPVTWTGINLCGAKSVTLRRSAAAGAWVDYDQ